VKRSYRELVKVWHPDRFGGDPKLQHKAQEKLKQINYAYERICKGMDAEPRHKTTSARSQPSGALANGYDWAPDVIAWVGVATALVAATIAVAQNDIKKVLAYSTVSQLGYMFLAVGTGAYVAAVFHMVTHAFFKALLFLGSGSVIHAMHDEQDMRRMGGLRKYLPITAGAFIAGWLAIAGVPPFAGFWSKDEILLFAFEQSPILWALGLLTALLTAFYMSRQVFLVFFGEERWSNDAVDDASVTEPHESPWLMTVPLVVLAGLSLLGGGANLPFGHTFEHLERWLEPVLEGNERVIDASGGLQVALALLALATAVIGIGLAYRIYLQHKQEPVEPEVLANGLYYDSSISAFMDGPGRRGFEAVATFDNTVIDGAVNGVGAAVRGGAGRLRVLQTGYVRSYALGVAVGVVALLVYFLTRGGVG
jgi:NADH-quinone oxidoreductase subunit L